MPRRTRQGGPARATSMIVMRHLLVIAVGGLLAWGGSAWGQAAAAVPAAKPAPAAEWLRQRAAQQAEQGRAFPALHGFQLTDRWEQSGIRFASRAVEDANKQFKQNHYDHGTGLAAADVDGDGRPDLYFVSQLGDRKSTRLNSSHRT